MFFLRLLDAIIYAFYDDLIFLVISRCAIGRIAGFKTTLRSVFYPRIMPVLSILHVPILSLSYDSNCCC